MIDRVGSRMFGARRVAAGMCALAPGLLVLVLAPGCSKPPRIVEGGNEAAGSKEDPWKAVAKQLRKESDFAACRAALGKLASALANDEKAPRPRGLTPAEEDALAKLVPLSKEDRDEIRGADFTAHDSAYVAECLYLRDAVRAFDVADVPDEKPEQGVARRADAAFAWVCRQVYLQPWLAPVPDSPGRLQAAALPPTSVLRRGSGSGLERMYVFLALLQQMGLDGCLVGPKDAEKMPAGYVAMGPDNTMLTGKPRGPFWAVGVRTGTDVRLYDPWRGKPFPASLAQLRASPESQKAWFEDKANVSGVTAELMKDAAVCLAVPVNALAPRMAMLEEHSRAELGARLAIDAAKLRDALPGSKFWNPPTDRYAYGRTARLFLPVEMGGTDQAGASGGLFGLYVQSQLPPPAFLLPAELTSRPELVEDVGQRIIQFARNSYGVAFIQPPTPRERLQRGQFQDASRELVKRENLFADGLLRLRNTPDADKQIRQWAEKAVELYGDEDRARLNGDADARGQAKAAIDLHWSRDPRAQLLVDRAVSGVGMAEATFLLALCRHEQAERLQAQLDSKAADPKLREEVAEAWADARDAWRSYASRSTAHAPFPGRAAHAQTLTARAEEMAKKK